MEPARSRRAVASAVSVATTLGLSVEEPLVLNDSDRLVVRLLPADSVARVAPIAHRDGTADEVDIVRRLNAVGAPVAALDPRVEARVYAADGFDVTFWVYHGVSADQPLTPQAYGPALAALHAGLRRLDLDVPHLRDRVQSAMEVVTDPMLSPKLTSPDRALIVESLNRSRARVLSHGAREQVLHGEPHLENVLRTRHGLQFIDLTTCISGPVEFDLAAALMPSAEGHRFTELDEVCDRYPGGVDRGLVEQSCTLIWAMITCWRWRIDDQLPRGSFWASEGLRQLRARS